MDSRDEDTPIEALAAAITAGAVRLAAATASWLGLVGGFDERGGWHGMGIRSCAEWLAWQCGLSPGTAREHVRVARTLRSLPLIGSTFAAGRLSFSKVRALTRIAEPDCEAALVEFSLSATASQTERFCRKWRRVEDEARDRRRPGEGLLFEYTTDDEGFFTLRVRGPVERGAPMMAAIDSLAERDARRERAQNKKAAARHEAARAAGGTVAPDLAERCAEGLAGLAADRAASPAYVGVHPFDQISGRRPAPLRTDRPRRPSGRRDCVRPAAERRLIDRVLFPDGERRDLPDTLQERYDRMNLMYAIGVLMTNRDITRRLAAEAGVTSDDVPAGTSGAGRG